MRYTSVRAPLVVLVLAACGAAPSLRAVPPRGAAPLVGLCRTLAVHPIAGGPSIDPEVPPVFAGAVGGRLVIAEASHGVIAHVYDPHGDRWTTLRGGTAALEPRAGYDRGGVTAVAGDHDLVLVWWTPAHEIDHVVHVDLAAGTVRELPVTGAPSWQGGIAVVAGGALVAWPQARPAGGGLFVDFAHGGRLELATGAWSALPADHAPPELVRTWTAAGDDVMTWSADHGGSIFDTRRLAWRDVGGPPGIQGWLYAWQGRVALLDDTHAFVYELGTGRWQPAGAVPPRAHTGGWSYQTTAGRFIAYLDGGGPGWVFDLSTGQWRVLPRGPAEGAFVPQATLLDLPDRGAVLARSDQLDAIDYTDQRWCTVPTGLPVLASDHQLAAWSGAAPGVYGAFQRVPPPACPPGAPCWNPPTTYTFSPAGSVLSW